MQLRSCRRVSIVAVLLALGLTVGCESKSNSGSVATSAERAGRAVFGSEIQKTPDSNLAGDIRSTSEPEESEAALIDPVVASKPVERPTDGLIVSASVAEPPELVTVEEKVDPSQFPGGIVPASPNAEPLPGGPRLLVPERTFRLEGRPRALRISYDDLDLLKVLNMGDPLPPDTVEQFPDWLRELDGKTVRLRGFMYPAYQQMLSAFILTRDTGVCCFGPNPKVYYLVGVKLKEGTEVRYIENRPFDVVGTFHIDPRYVDGTWYQLYKISDAIVAD